MRKRSYILIALALFLVFPFLPATAQSFTFAGPNFFLNLPDQVYSPVLTPDNLQQNEGFIQSQGGTLESWTADFAARGVLLMAYDQANSRVLLVTAEQDVDGQRLFDINEHDSDTRARYRLSHGKDGAYAILGYRYDSVSWKNFKNIGRFLQLRYSFRQGGEVVRRGFQRRSIRNGYTITVDMQVFGRQLSGGDNTALNKVFDTLSFSQVLPLPPLPISLDESATAPVETSKSEFTMRGITKPGASLRAALMSFGAGSTTIFEATANKNGAYTLPITMPGEDVYLMTLTVSAQGAEDLSKTYNIRYQKGLLPAQITAEPPAELTGDSLTLAGYTSEAGVSATLRVNGQDQSLNVPRNGNFSFQVDTSQEGKYEIRLTLSKRGFDDRVFAYTANRFLSQEARETVLNATAQSPSYQELMENPESFDGRLLRFTGTIIEKHNDTDTWVFHLATKKDGSNYGDIVILTSEADQPFTVNTQVRVYGQMVGMYLAKDLQGEELSLPNLQLSMMLGQ